MALWGRSRTGDRETSSESPKPEALPTKDEQLLAEVSAKMAEAERRRALPVAEAAPAGPAQTPAGGKPAPASPAHIAAPVTAAAAPQQVSPPQAPPIASPPPEVARAAAAPSAPAAAALQANKFVTRIGREITVTGTISGAEDILVAGEVRGNIDVQSNVEVERSGRLEADIVADRIAIAGSVRGSVIARERLEIAPQGELSGDVDTPRIVIAHGAAYQGWIRTRRTRPAGGEGSGTEERKSPKTSPAPTPAPSSAPRATGEQKLRRAADELRDIAPKKPPRPVPPEDRPGGQEATPERPFSVATEEGQSPAVAAPKR
ncbi:MAG: polymer-forming cytoskeletal protein [Candidatus Schekmanbacteria bacterium]|nr:polymer-forming cytoskeletal protein [Candidatus Schekmanbacteria bacterium]